MFTKPLSYILTALLIYTWGLSVAYADSRYNKLERYDRVKCSNINIGHNYTYSVCDRYKNPEYEAQQQELLINQQVAQIRNQIEDQFKTTWIPPYGYSGYLLYVSYGLDILGNLTFVQIKNDVPADLIHSVENHLHKLGPFKPINKPEVLFQLSNNEFKLNVK